MDSPDWQETTEALEGSIRDLTRQVSMLRRAVEDLREDVFAEFPHRRREPFDPEIAPAVTPPVHLKSMPLDPCDPEFGRKINAIEAAVDSVTPPERPRSATLNEFVARLTSEPPVDQIGFGEWTDGRAVDSGQVVEVDGELFDWFADHFDAEYEAPGGAYVLSGDDGGQYVLWSSESDIFLRRLTDSDEAEFAELMRMAAEKAALKREQFRDPHSPQKQQGCLW